MRSVLSAVLIVALASVTIGAELPYVTLTLKDGSAVEGYLFDRDSAGQTLAQCKVRIFVKNSDEKRTIPYNQIAALAFTGRDTAAGKSWETWLKKYADRKAAGETGIRIDPEKLD